MLGYTYQFTRAAERVADAGRLAHRRAAPRVRAVRLDGRVVLPRPARRLPAGVPVPGDRPGCIDLRRSGDRRRRAGPDPGHPCDGHGAVGHRAPGHRGLGVHGQPRSRRRSRRRHRLSASTTGPSARWGRREACAPTSRRNRSSGTTGPTVSSSRTSSPAPSTPTSTTAPARTIEPLTADEVFPSAAPSRGFADLIAGTRREPGARPPGRPRRRVPRGGLPLGGQRRRSPVRDRRPSASDRDPSVDGDAAAIVG